MRWIGRRRWNRAQRAQRCRSIYSWRPQLAWGQALPPASALELKLQRQQKVASSSSCRWRSSASFDPRSRCQRSLPEPACSEGVVGVEAEAMVG